MKIQLKPTGIEWNFGNRFPYWGYFYWWNWLPKDSRYLGYEQDYYDWYINSFGFWFINWSWQTYYTKERKVTNLKR